MTNTSSDRRAHGGATGYRVLVLFLALAACSVDSAPRPHLANPASQNCIDKGGKLVIERQPDGGQYGVCLFGDDRQCEEWALMRGQCSAGGVRVTGYVTPAARYCAISGGNYAVVARSGASGEQGTCTVSGGRSCDADAYYRGMCGR